MNQEFSRVEKSTRGHTLLLTSLLALFCLRVLGQIAVALFHPQFLPPMEEWLSGLMPYPLLLCCQLLIIGLFSKIIRDISSDEGFFSHEHHKLGLFLRHFGAIYLLVMLLRYAIRMFLYSNERWTGGAIPIVFHCVLATFIIIWGQFYLSRTQKNVAIFKRKATRFAFIGITAATICIWAFWQVLPSLIAQSGNARPSQYAVRIEPHVPLIMSDSVILYADIFHPCHLKHSPTVLVRIPFTKNLKNSTLEILIARMWSERGYTVVIQGTRGRGESGGSFYPMINERQDGSETLQWLRLQPWFDGQIAMWGGSASGQALYSVCDLKDQKHPALNALCAYEASTNFHDMFYQGGAFSLYSALAWATYSGGKADLPNWPKPPLLIRAAYQVPEGETDKETVGHEVKFFRDWLAHKSKDTYWQKVDGINRASDMNSPIISMAGWYDPFLCSQLEDWKTITASSNDKVRSSSRLIIGPWTHGHDANLPENSSKANFRLSTVTESLSFFDSILEANKIQNSGATHLPGFPVRIFVMGKNQWRDETEFPPKRANPCAIRLSPSRPVIAYDYNPQDPVPTCGGSMIGCEKPIEDQRAVESRPDVITFTTPTLEKDLEVTGFVRAMLWVNTSAESADFTAKLVDVFPDKRAINISDGILRRNYDHSDGYTFPKEVEIKLPPTSNVFLKGHRIRLEISSSNFPRYDRNMCPGQQQIYCATRYPSRLILPVVGRIPEPDDITMMEDSR